MESSRTLAEGGLNGMDDVDEIIDKDDGPRLVRLDELIEVGLLEY